MTQDDDKMITSMTFKLPVELKEVIESLSVQEDVSASVFIRNAITDAVTKRKNTFDSLSKVFGSQKNTSNS